MYCTSALFVYIAHNQDGNQQFVCHVRTIQARLDKAHDRHIAFAAAESIATTRRRAMALERKRRLLETDNTSTVTMSNSTGTSL
jgi:hypothetical protein